MIFFKKGIPSDSGVDYYFTGFSSGVNSDRDHYYTNEFMWTPKLSKPDTFLLLSTLYVQ